MLFIVASTLVTASAVSMCGQVGWIGLLIPHASRMLVGSNNRYVVPLSLDVYKRQVQDCQTTRIF